MLVILALLVGDPMWSVNVDGQFDYRPANDQQFGFGFGIGGRRHELGLGAVSLWGGMDVFYDRYSETVRVMTSSGSYDDAALLTVESFLPVEAVRLDSGLWSFELAGAGGPVWIHYARPLPTGNGIDHSEIDFAVRGIASTAYQFWHDTAIEFRFAYTYTYLSTQMPDAASQYSIGVGGVYRF